ncbi:MAG: RhuM family protein [Verrucomicrobiia bacterium]
MSANENKPGGEVILYQTEDLQTRLEVRLEGETVWLTQAQMAELFQTTIPNVSMHIRNVFAEGELQADSVVKEFLTTATDGKNYSTKFHNLDVIISVGYRVKSHRGTQFRIWATKRLREYIVKGFTMDDERLKNPPGKGRTDYFDELLARKIPLHESGSSGPTWRSSTLG